MQPYLVAETHNIEEARRLLVYDPAEEVASELAWAAADHGCPEIVALALPHLHWPAGDRRWHWILMQPIRGCSPQSSANEGHFQCMALLLDHGIDPNITRYGQTTLHFAAARPNVPGPDRARFAAMLLDHGADLALRDDLLCSTPLGWACRWGRTELVELLLERGASVAEPDAEPWATPTAWATKHHQPEILARLDKSQLPRINPERRIME
jgi:hypothetical protein